MTTEGTAAAWAAALAQVIDAAHLSAGEQMSVMVDAAVRPLGLTAELFMVDLGQHTLTPVTLDTDGRLDVDATLAGRCYQLGEILPGTGHDGERVLWVPVLDGSDRAGVLRVGLDHTDDHAGDPVDGQTYGAGRGGDGAADGVEDGAELRRWLWTFAGLVGHILMAKLVYSDHLRRIRAGTSLSQASELLWQLLPPRTFATERVVVSALLEPHADVAGDAYDYNVERDVIDLAVFDAAGHDLQAGLTTAVAITAVRNARRAEKTDLLAIAAQVDDVIATRPGLQFATAVLARLDTTTGMMDYLIAGHPAPLLLRAGTVVKELGAAPRVPLGVIISGASPGQVGREQLEPGDWLLFYSDGIVEARDENGEFFDEQRLIELLERAAAGHLSAPETLRRLTAAVLGHQGGVLQDDATLLLVEWSPTAHLRMFPTLDEHDTG
ncbi:MAG TPA: PP2C family protein-serine/threonine phosphatase [Pseudonocardia sp.]|nr:PP2C family protein-serine/threonine phosphatase [Pseudonocardia sp.]